MPRPFAAAIAAVLFVTTSEAFAIAQRTFVSTAGNDANTAANCGLVSPCRSFGGALSVTAADGEIVVLDSGGYGRVTIDKSVAIIAPTGVYAGISVLAATNGVDVDGATIVVVLRGLSINGQGGDKGIAFAQGARLYIEHCTISNMADRAVELRAGETYITDTTIRDNQSFGIWAEGFISVIIDRTRVERHVNTGVHVANGPRLTMTNSVVAGNGGFGGFDINTNDGSSQTAVTVTDSNVSRNLQRGISVRSSGTGSFARLALTRSTISQNDAEGIQLSAVTGALTAVITDNTIVRNFGNGGIHATGIGVSATIAANAISANSFVGVFQGTNATLKTRANNIVQNNTPDDVSGTLTFVGGD